MTFLSHKWNRLRMYLSNALEIHSLFTRHKYRKQLLDSDVVSLGWTETAMRPAKTRLLRSIAGLVRWMHPQMTMEWKHPA